MIGGIPWTPQTGHYCPSDGGEHRERRPHSIWSAFCLAPATHRIATVIGAIAPAVSPVSSLLTTLKIPIPRSNAHTTVQLNSARPASPTVQIGTDATALDVHWDW